VIVQAAKIIGSGLATIGLNNILLSVLHNDNLLLSKIIYTKLVNNAIFTVENMINSLSDNSIILKFLEKEIPLSHLEIRGKNKNNVLVVDDLVPLTPHLNLGKIINTDSNFYTSGVYLLKAPNDKQYLGSCMNFYLRLAEHKNQFKHKRKPTKLHLYKYKFNEYKWGPIYKTMN